jgi:single-strand DNA-binding protein
VNKVILVGRLTRDAEVRTFASGSKVANFGFCVNNRKKDDSTGTWSDDPVYLECSAFGKTADLVDQYLKKGSQAYLEGHLKLETWADKTSGEKRSKLKIVVDHVQFLDARRGGDDDHHHSQPEPRGQNHHKQEEPKEDNQSIPF